MHSTNLQIQINAMAIMVRAKGMEADNLCRTFKNESPCYNDSDFEHLACELDFLAREVFHDNYTNPVSNTQRYKMLGNGSTVDVITHILRGLNKC